ncbi:DUF624 domain-containing protein [Domibacillus iocasae]|nr:DUF624 domain-containing protein [Domibacillus iocasae]
MALIPTGPAIHAILFSMDKLVRTKELSPARDFWQSFRSNIKETMMIWLI